MADALVCGDCRVNVAAQSSPKDSTRLGDDMQVTTQRARHPCKAHSVPASQACPSMQAAPESAGSSHRSRASQTSARCHTRTPSEARACVRACVRACIRAEVRADVRVFVRMGVSVRATCARARPCVRTRARVSVSSAPVTRWRCSGANCDGTACGRAEQRQPAGGGRRRAAQCRTFQAYPRHGMARRSWSELQLQQHADVAGQSSPSVAWMCVWVRACVVCVRAGMYVGVGACASV
jgi:hypothetical protein